MTVSAHQAFYLHHLGIPCWSRRPLVVSAANEACVWVVSEHALLSEKASLLLTGMLQSIQLSMRDVRLVTHDALRFDLRLPSAVQAMLCLGTAHADALHGMLLPRVETFALEHLLLHPLDKRQAYLDLLQLKQLLVESRA